MIDPTKKFEMCSGCNIPYREPCEIACPRYLIGIAREVEGFVERIANADAVFIEHDTSRRVAVDPSKFFQYSGGEVLRVKQSYLGKETMAFYRTVPGAEKFAFRPAHGIERSIELTQEGTNFLNNALKR